MSQQYQVKHSDNITPKPQYVGWYVVDSSNGEFVDGPMERDAAQARAEEANTRGPEPDTSRSN